VKGELTLERSTGDSGRGAISVARIPGVSELWRETKGDLRVTIAVVDGPVDRAHPALVAARLEIIAGLAPVKPVIQWGEAYRSTGLLAPGANLRAAVPGGGVMAVSGTSFAAAVVSGVAGLLLSLAKVQGLRQSGQQVRHFLLDWARKCLEDSISNEEHAP
jgi:subtilisin family serine protease